MRHKARPPLSTVVELHESPSWAVREFYPLFHSGLPQVASISILPPSTPLCSWRASLGTWYSSRSLKHLNAASAPLSWCISSSQPCNRSALPSTKREMASLAICVDLLGKPFGRPGPGFLPFLKLVSFSMRSVYFCLPLRCNVPSSVKVRYLRRQHDRHMGKFEHQHICTTFPPFAGTFLLPC